MKKNQINWQDILNMFLFIRFKRLGSIFAISNLLYKFLHNADKNSETLKKEIKKQVKERPLGALALSFLLGWLLTRILK